MLPAPCPLCSRQFGHRGKLNRHVLSHTGEKPHPCPLCDARFRSNYALQRHVNSHSGAKKYFCDDCEKGFSSKEHLARHFKGRKHQPFTCQTCGGTFFRTSSLQSHKCDLQAPVPPPQSDFSSLVCTVCNRGFTSPVKLTLHYLSKSHAKKNEGKTVGETITDGGSSTAEVVGST